MTNETKNERTILTEARELVDGDRQSDYGHPRDNHRVTALMWGAYLARALVVRDQFEVTPQDVCMLNILQKVSRYANRPKRDTLVDIAGYARNAEMCGDALGIPTDADAEARLRKGDD